MSRVWDFGDGTGSGEENPFHFYRDEGHYEVTLTVTDNGGASDSKTHDAKVKD
jgi:xanthomonalisin